MGIGPIIAIPKVLAKVGLTTEDVDLFEVRLINKRKASV
jgi:acetyl-CoA acetyltransferase